MRKLRTQSQVAWRRAKRLARRHSARVRAAAMRLAAAGSTMVARMAHAWRDPVSLARVTASTGALLLLAMLTALPAGAVWPAVLAVAGGALCLVSVHVGLRLALTGPPAETPERLDEIGERLERRFEQLQDARWQLSETEARYRGLLDAQDEIILRRDAATGSLSYANASFHRVFGVPASEVLHRPFRPVVLETEGDGPLSPGENERRRRYVELIETVAGQRWIAWEEHLVSGLEGGPLEIQCVGRDVTEARKGEAQLAEARDNADAANRAKSRFLAAMSHEIRTPMNGILGMADLLLGTSLEPDQVTYTRAIDQSARTLLALIDEILDFSKIEAGKLVLQDAPFVLETCVQSAIELLAPRAQEKGLELAWTISPELPRRLRGDEARVRQILLNLLSNAVKFTDTGGVLVKVDGQPGRDRKSFLIRLTVEDTGIGLSPSDLKQLFAEFEQSATARRRQGGTGLGLSISRRLALAMGGDITVVSNPGKGSTFTVELRLACHQAAEDPLTREAPLQVRVLVALDNPIERQALASMLHRSVDTVVETDMAGAEARIDEAAALAKPFDRLIVDVAADAGTCAALLARARQLAPSAGVQGIVLVNVLSRSSLAAHKAAGFAAYLVKPVRPASILQQLGSPAAASSRPKALSAGEPEQGLATRPLQTGKPWRILLAEDNDINALLARRVIELAGCEVDWVHNGREAIAAATACLDGATAYDLVLMDVFMPEVDGLEATAEIKRRFAERAASGGSPPPCPPIIALTANAFTEDRRRCLEAGMDDYLAKPFERADLEGLVGRWLGSGDAALARRDSRPAA